MRLGLLTQWYDPEPGPAALPGALARGLRERGHEVHVLTGFPNYPSGRLADGYRLRPYQHEMMDGVHVHRSPLYPNHDASTMRRVANYASFAFASALVGPVALPRLDALWVNYSPITVALPMWVLQAAQGVPVVLDVGDLWPDTMLVSGLAGGERLGSTAESLLHAWCSRMYKSADAVTYISPGVGPILERRGVPAHKLHFVPKWATEEVFHPGGSSLRARYDIPDSTVVLLYAGALGRAQGLESLIDAAAGMGDHDFVCLIAGSGNAERDLRARASERGASCVRFIGRVPQSEMTDLMATADLSYVSLADHPLSPVTMPSKTQAALAAGRPLLVAAPGDVSSLASTMGVGFTARPADPESIRVAMTRAVEVGRAGLQTMGLHARRCYDETFSLQRGVSQVEDLLLSASLRRAHDSRPSPVDPDQEALP